ncbi:MAG: exonuclease subunit SbcD [Muribaculaceae bacterium]|nr:exonuclease subunit SbcD [Muribaculaceae bacterium]
MMKIIATADWHLGNMFHGNDRLAEQAHFLSRLLEMLEEERPDVLVVAGDVYDNGNPSAAAQTLYYEFLDSVTARLPGLHIVITAGNHDSPNRLEAPRPIMERHRVHIRGKVGRRWEPGENDAPGRWVNDYDDLLIPIPDDESGGVKGVIAAVPYLRSDIAVGDSYAEAVRSFMKELTARARELYPGRPVVMAAHLYATGSVIAPRSSERIIVGGQEQVSLSDWPEHPEYLVSGHIHKRQRLGATDWARYPGSVLPMSFAEKDYRHGVDLVTLANDGTVEVRQLEYAPQRQLLIIPEEGPDTRHTPAQLTRIIKSMLTERTSDLPDEEAPYVMLYIHQSKINADKKREIEELIASRNAVLCGTQAVSDTVVHTLDGGDTLRTVEDILERSVMDTLEEAFRMRHERDLSDRQREMLTNLLEKLG